MREFRKWGGRLLRSGVVRVVGLAREAHVRAFLQSLRAVAFGDVSRNRIELAARLTAALALIAVGIAIGRLTYPSAEAAYTHDAVRSVPKHSPSPVAAGLIRKDVVLRRGQSLDLLLARAGIAPAQRESAERALRRRCDPRRLVPGTRLALTIRRDGNGARSLMALHLRLSQTADITLVARRGGQFDPTGQRAAESADDRTPGGGIRSISGKVGKNFAVSLRAAGLPSVLVRQVREALVYDPDLPARPPAGVRFNIDYRGGPRSGARKDDALQRVALTIHGRTHSVYRYSVSAGLVAFVEPDGRGILRAHLAKPLRHARVSSPWGWRIHPVLHRPEFHKGIDLAAPAGTPVRAAAAGKVVFAGRHGNYGRLVKLQHSGELLTTYGHLQGFAKGLHIGSHVVKGQVIGYVGETGLATGPHLYYEVYVAGRRVNPAKKSLVVPIRLAGANLHRFRRWVTADRRSLAEE